MEQRLRNSSVVSQIRDPVCRLQWGGPEEAQGVQELLHTAQPSVPGFPGENFWFTEPTELAPSQTFDLSQSGSLASFALAGRVVKARE